MAPLTSPRSASDAGGHDATLGHQLGLGRRLPQLLPQGVDLGVAAEGPVAVGQHRVLLHRPGGGPEGLQVAGRLRPPAQPVEGQPGQLPHRRHVGRVPEEGTEQAHGVLGTAPLEGGGGLDQPGLHLGRDAARRRPGPARRPPAGAPCAGAARGPAAAADAGGGGSPRRGAGPSLCQSSGSHAGGGPPRWSYSSLRRPVVGQPACCGRPCGPGSPTPWDRAGTSAPARPSAPPVAVRPRRRPGPAGRRTGRRGGRGRRRPWTGGGRRAARRRRTGRRPDGRAAVRSRRRPLRPGAVAAGRRSARAAAVRGGPTGRRRTVDWPPGRPRSVRAGHCPVRSSGPRAVRRSAPRPIAAGRRAAGRPVRRRAPDRSPAGRRRSTARPAPSRPDDRRRRPAAGGPSAGRPVAGAGRRSRPPPVGRRLAGPSPPAAGARPAARSTADRARAAAALARRADLAPVGRPGGRTGGPPRAGAPGAAPDGPVRARRRRDGDDGEASVQTTESYRTQNAKKAPRRGAFFKKSGGDLLSQGDSPQVPSALVGLTSVFGMGTGVTPPL